MVCERVHTAHHIVVRLRLSDSHVTRRSGVAADTVGVGTLERRVAALEMFWEIRGTMKEI